MGNSLENPLQWDWAGDADFAAFREELAGIGYAPAEAAAELGVPSVEALYPLDYRLLPVLLDRLESSSRPRAVAVKLLLLGLPVRSQPLCAALADRSVDFMLRAGLAVEQEGMFHALLSVVPFQHLQVVSDKLFMNADPGFTAEGLSSENAVWRLDRTTRIMARALPRRGWRSVLEPCCGSGALSLLLAGRAGRITGTDINPRAVNVARFNARLNGAANAEFRQGDLYAGLGQEHHDLILANPPSAPGLVRAWNREGGTAGREVVEPAIAGALPRLADGGLLLCSLHLGYRDDRDIQDWVARQFPAGEYRTLVVRHAEHWSADEYALNEALRKSGPRDLETYRRTYRMYRDGLERGGIGTVAFAVLAARRGGNGSALVSDELYQPGWERRIVDLAG
ncbi:MAG: methyltransferase [Candidatus Edwardsbacteria bacterium]|jgi:SAM-dependent methyltransferase|nr:methyltransferase [Candidatus Edwardsbacteria bacterium]